MCLDTVFVCRAPLINLTHCRYDSGRPKPYCYFVAVVDMCCAVVRRVARRCGLQPVVGEGEDWTVYWVDTSVMMERVMDMKRYQVSHCPGGAMSDGGLSAPSTLAENQPFSRDGRDLPEGSVG